MRRCSRRHLTVRSRGSRAVRRATAHGGVDVALHAHLHRQLCAGTLRVVADRLGRGGHERGRGFAGVDARVVDPGLQAPGPLGQPAEQRRDSLQRELKRDSGRAEVMFRSMLRNSLAEMCENEPPKRSMPPQPPLAVGN